MGRRRLPDEDVEEIHEELFAAGVLAPLDLGGVDERAWADCDLASLAENRLGDTTDPRGIGEHQRELWRSNATTEPEYLPSMREHERCCWLIDAGARAGTIALSTTMLGTTSLRIASLYVYPSFRGRGLGREALRQVARCLDGRGGGIRLNTSWAWQRTVRAYLHMGMWVRMWKRDLDLRFSSSDPLPVLDVNARSASIGAQSERGLVPLLDATHDGRWLTIVPAAGRDDGDGEELAWDAWGTLSLALALEGWPLVRSEEEWERCRYSDAEAPESLAYKIQIWEAWDRAHGWVVETPRIPGLEYPTWAELEARWQSADLS